MGFGLFVPELRSAFPMSPAVVGLVSSLGFLGFFAGLLAAPALLARGGPRLPVLTGLAAATAGMGLVAAAPGLPVLAAGVFLAASSAGLAWTPFNDAVYRNVGDRDRASALSAVSTGTGVGIALAGAAALAAAFGALSWRTCWALFAAAAAAAFLGNRLAFRGVDDGRDPAPPSRWRALARPAAAPLFLVGLVYGTTSAIYIAFAADHVAGTGGLPGVPAGATPAIVYLCYGLLGLAGLATGRVRDRIGLPLLLRLLMAAAALSAALVAMAPGSWAGLTLSAGLQGVHVMMTSAVLAFWSGRLFPALPSIGFTAALLAAAAGSVLGPAVAGLVADAFGTAAMFLAASALPAVTALMLRDRHAREHPVS